jgi:glucokinase
MTYFVGVDVGGTKSAAALIDDSGETRARHWIEHRGTSVTPLAEIVLESVVGVLDEGGVAAESVQGYGVAIAGLISSDQSTVVNAAKLRVRHLDLGAELSGRLGRRVLVENDANATLFGHHNAGVVAASGGVASTEVSLLLALGTGIGGSVMAGGSTIIGANGFAAELGHIVVDYDDERLCLCGSPGCVENYACGRGVEELAVIDPPSDSSRQLIGLSPAEVVTGRHVVALAERGDSWAVALLELAGTMLGRALTILCTTLDPTSVVIGGSFGHGTATWVLPAARVEMAKRWPFRHERELPDITVDTIGPYAAATGAALMARRTITDEQEHS